MLTIPEAAAHFKVSVPTIRRWIRSGRVRSQLTLGPFGEQWMVDPNAPESAPVVSETLASASLPTQAYVAMDQLIEKAPSSGGGGVDQALLKEAEEALEEAWQARQRAEQELAELKASRQDGDLLALRQDLEGSERHRQALLQQVGQLQASQQEAWQETRTALRALQGAYEVQEDLQRRLHLAETESECLRRSMARRLGLNWQEHNLMSLYLRFESSFEENWDLPTQEERSQWSAFRRRSLSAEAPATTESA